MGERSVSVIKETRELASRNKWSSTARKRGACLNIKSENIDDRRGEKEMLWVIFLENKF